MSVKPIPRQIVYPMEHAPSLFASVDRKVKKELIESLQGIIKTDKEIYLVESTRR